ncbi:MAG: HAD-superfamily hydrolase, subfamily variant 3 [Gammaproteobacteria bacterium]|nr:HAD-superfamily hydrolase, subfamily variant 3 [Gammaproteobacteria bacterium]
MKLGALIFDVDGTLADTEEAHRCAFNDAFRQLGMDWNWSRPTYAHLLATTGGKERLAAFIGSLPLAPAERLALTGRIEAIHAAKTQNYTRMVLAGEVPLRDGVARLLDDAARSSIRLGIASTTSFVNIEALLRTCLGPGAIDRFAVIGAGDQVARKKPAADIYEYVLKRLNAAPHECVAIEDSANGLEAAKAAGLYTLITPSYWTRSEDFSSADLVLPSLGSIERPLTPRAALIVGNRVLGIRELDRRLHAIREYQ